MLGVTSSAWASASLFQNVGSGHCMSDDGHTASGSLVGLESCDSGTNNQVWAVVGASGGGINISNLGNGSCLTNTDGAFVDGSPQSMFGCPSGADSNYKNNYVAFAANDAGTQFHIETVTSNDGVSGYCLSSDGNNAAGAPVVESTCNGSANQTWIASALIF
jgi:hypothetical protein